MRAYYPKCEILLELQDGAHPAVAAEFGKLLSAAVKQTQRTHARAVNGEKMEFECKWMDMYEITEKLQSTAWDIKRADELAGDYRELHNVPTDGR